MRKLYLFLLPLLPAVPLRAAEVAAVLSSDAPYYHDALRDFERIYGSTVPLLSVDAPVSDWPRDVRVAVTFGAKAALVPLPAGVSRVACMAPVIPAGSSGTLVQVQFLPAAATVAAQVKEVCPRIKRITVYWVSPVFDEYVTDLAAAFKPKGVAVELYRLAKGDDFSFRLGALAPPAEGLWIPPDPAMINSLNIQVALQYASFNRSLFMSPNAQFVEMGAALASVPPRDELARLAAEAARRLLAGRSSPPVLFSKKADLYLNRSALKQGNAPLTLEVEKKARAVY